MGCLSPVLTAAAAMSCRPMFTARGGDRADVRREAKSLEGLEIGPPRVRQRVRRVDGLDEQASDVRGSEPEPRPRCGTSREPGRSCVRGSRRLDFHPAPPPRMLANRQRRFRSMRPRRWAVPERRARWGRVGSNSGAEQSRRRGCGASLGGQRGFSPGRRRRRRRGDETKGRRAFSGGGPETGLLVYQEEVTTSKTFIRDTTAVPDASVLLFGGELCVDHASASVSRIHRSFLGGGRRDGFEVYVPCASRDGGAVQAAEEGAYDGAGERGGGSERKSRDVGGERAGKGGCGRCWRRSSLDPVSPRDKIKIATFELFL